MIETKIPRRLDSDSLHDFKCNWADAFREDPKGMWLLNSHILVVPTIKTKYDTEDRMYVYAYDRNKFLIGEFRPDHGMIRSGEYYPIIVFYNRLNYLPGYNGFNIGVPNNTRIAATAITTDTIPPFVLYLPENLFLLFVSIFMMFLSSCNQIDFVHYRCQKSTKCI